MELKEIELGRTVDILDQFLEIMDSKFRIISIKNDELDLSYLRNFKINVNKHIIIIKKDNFIEKYIIKRFLNDEDIEIIKKDNKYIELFILEHVYWELYIYYFKYLEVFLNLSKIQQRKIFNDTYY